MPPPRIAIFFGDVLDDIIDRADLVLQIECERTTVAVNDEAGKRRDDRRVSLV